MSKKRHLPDWMVLCKSRKMEEMQEEVNQKNDEKVQKRKEDIIKEKNTKFDKALQSAKQKFKEEKKEAASQVFEQIMNEQTKEMKFEGKLIYSSHTNDCNMLCEDIEMALCDLTEAFVGFDMEWPVSYKVGKEDKTALIQICTAPDTCYLFHISCMGCIPSNLKSLLLNKHIKKVGVNIESDIWKLERDYDIHVIDIIKNSMEDIGVLANKILGCKEHWSLEGLVKHLFNHKINKDPILRKGDWSKYPLSEEQKCYAATDAYVSYKVYEKLMNKQSSDL
ncbi:bifunctional 3'-5' exonuclease/ATP-dependent helicase WRN-like [Mytilus galloprovincialis]|uniref:bifunctional 3'-5' exonuclease/ATP-dependent helicase WRN-like n=1 Tax=Mytilus galloprovincialis TaxID=29158 RepID=UPI003F7B9024